MKAKPLTVHWHQDDQPIYSADFQPNTPSARGLSPRLATAGGDNNVRLWQLNLAALHDGASDPSSVGAASVVYVATLEKHTQAVNVVKFDPTGRLLASAGDDGVICIWSLGSSEPTKSFGEELIDAESWRVVTTCRGTGAEIYDLAWSPDSKYIAAGLMDNTTRIYDASAGKCIKELAEHGHYVQGVTWDPSNEYIATQSSDRTMLVYKVSTKNGALVVHTPPQRTTRRDLDGGRLAVYHNETFTSFFRRLAFSPDGTLLISPAGQVRRPQQPDMDAFYIFTRAGLGKDPVALVYGDKPSLAVAFSTVPRQLPDGASPVIGLPYRLIYAVALYDSVVIYDTCSAAPLAQVRSIHYSSLTDLVWTPDGETLLVTSTDGFCSALLFEAGDLGPVYTGPLVDTKPTVAISPVKEKNKQVNLQTLLTTKAAPSPPPAPVFTAASSDKKAKKRVAPTLLSSVPPAGPPAAP